MSNPNQFGGGGGRPLNIPPPPHRRSISSHSHFLWKPVNTAQTYSNGNRPSDSWSWRAPQAPIGRSAVGQQRQTSHQPQLQTAAPQQQQPRQMVQVAPQPQFMHLTQQTAHIRTVSGGATPMAPFGTAPNQAAARVMTSYTESSALQSNQANANGYAKAAASTAAAPSQRTSGVVHSLKHSYGFVRCDNSGHRVFFHFSELDQDSIAGLPDLGQDQPPVQIGDRVEFDRVRDADSGREKAVAVKVLQRSPYGGAPNAAPYSHSKAASMSAAPRAIPVPYSSGVLKEPAPEVPDDSRELRGVHNDGASRDVGVIVSTKHSYGFIKCAERDHKQVFFHFSEFMDDPSLIRPGAEIEFTISPNQNGKVVATRIRMLPAGSVQFATVEEDKITGVIKSGVENQQSTSQKTRRKARPSSMDVGSLIVPAEELQIGGVEASRKEHERTLTFSGADLKFPGIALMEGDEVEFRVKTDRRTHARTATEILLVRPNAAGRQRGIVTIWKDLYGFLKCDGRKDHLFFHLNEFIDKTHHPEVGDELEFNISLDNRGQDNAVRVSVLPKGTVQLHDDRIFGVILSRPPVASVPASRRTVSEISTTSAAAASQASYGIIRIFGVKDVDGTPVELTPQELEHLKPLPAETTTAAISPIAEESLSPKSSPHHIGHKSMASMTWRSGAIETATPDSPMESVRFTLGDRVETPFRRGDIISLAVAPAPKFLRASNLCLVPKVGVVGEVGSAHAIIHVESSAFTAAEDFTLRLNDLPLDFGALQSGDKVEIMEVTSGSGPRSLRYAKVVRRTQNTCIIDELKALVPELTEQFQSTVSKVPASRGVSAEKSGGDEAISKPTHKRWDSRLEPRNWS